MSLAYDEYLAEHLANVDKGLHWMLDNLPLTQEEKNAIGEAVAHTHDISKYETYEYTAYDQYFYGGNQSYAVKLAFDYAWLHHIHHNPHHWQYWVLLEDDPETGVPFKALQIPLPYIFEMVADWWTFSWKNNNLFEIFNWYADHRHKQFIHPESRAMLENILKKIWNVLIMQEAVLGHDVSEIEAQYMRVWAEQDDAAFNGYTFVPSEKIPDNVTMESSPEPVPNVKSTLPGIGMNGVFGTSYTNRFIEEMNNIKHSNSEPIGKVIGTRETENGLEVTVEHSGIKGQKWGIRNGPPYPLSVERNSKVRMNYIRDSKWIRTHQVPQSELERHPIEKLSDLKRLTKNDDITDVRWRVNAMKDNFIGRYYNCQNCAAAFDMIERGYNVCARPKQSGSNVGNIEDLYEGGHLSHCEMDKQLSDYEDAYQARREVGNKLVSELLSQGTGARGILVVGQARDRDMENTEQCSGFHAINYKVETESQGFLKGSKPVVKIYDMQSSHDYYHKGTSDYVTVFFDSDPRDIYFMRTDNLEPSDLMTTAVYSQNGIGELDYDKK